MATTLRVVVGFEYSNHCFHWVFLCDRRRPSHCGSYRQFPSLWELELPETCWDHWTVKSIQIESKRHEWIHTNGSKTIAMQSPPPPLVVVTWTKTKTKSMQMFLLCLPFRRFKSEMSPSPSPISSPIFRILKSRKAHQRHSPHRKKNPIRPPKGW